MNLFSIGLLTCLFSPLICWLILLVAQLLFKTVTEYWVTRVVRFVSFLVILGAALAIFSWYQSGLRSVQLDLGHLYQSKNYDFALCFFFDHVSAVYLAVTAVLVNVIIYFSQRYLHRDAGYFRFFSVILLLTFGMVLIIAAGTLDLLFAGWEVVGFCSFYLIAFYRHRRPAVENALRAYAIYRICDVGLLVGAWLAHAIWHDSHLFNHLESQTIVHHWFQIPVWQQWGLCTLILLAAIGKSGQFPFLTWVPRAMEGPTPSSAIFYGSLSIHAGMFLLIRTYPIWSLTSGFPVLVGAIGVLTAVITSILSRVQTSIKAQIGYASISQVGIMFFEVAMGWHHLALIHFVGNAFLRCFQLLVSPSIIAQQLQIQNFIGSERNRGKRGGAPYVPDSLTYSLYTFAVNDAYIDIIFKKWILTPILTFAARLNRFCMEMPRKLRLGISGATVTAPLGVFYFSDSVLKQFQLYEPIFFLLLILGSSLFAMGEKKRPFWVVSAVFVSQFYLVIALMLHAPLTMHDGMIYLGGLVSSFVFVWIALRQVTQSYEFHDLDQFHGLSGVFKNTEFLFLSGVLGLVGFPFFVTFLGEDLLLHHAFTEKWILTFALVFVFVINGITLLRLYCRIFLGSTVRLEQSQRLDFPRSVVALLILTGLLIEWIPISSKY